MSVQIGLTGYAGRSLVRSLSLNQDLSCFSAGTKTGYEIYSVDPLQRMDKVDNFPCGFEIVEMLVKTNIIALVGSSKSDNKKTIFKNTSVIVYDCSQKKVVVELKFDNEVLAVRLSHRRIFVSTLHRIFIFENNENFRILKKLETYNPHGVLCVSVLKNEERSLKYICCFPKKEKKGRMTVLYEGYDGKISMFPRPIECHDSCIYKATLSLTGKFLATVSKKGTLLRVFRTLRGNILQTFRRGKFNVKVYSLAFRKDCRFIALTSDSESVHIFQLRNSSAKDTFYSKYKIVGNAPYPPSICFFDRRMSDVMYVCNSNREIMKIRFDENKRGSNAKLDWVKDFSDTNL